MRIRYVAILLFCAWQQVSAQAPVAAFSGTPVSGCAPLIVTFTDQSTNNPTNWNWDFGNSQLSTNQNNTVTYTQPGTYTVQLIARNASGINSVTRTNYIVVNAPPVVDFNVSSSSGCAGTTFNFSDQTTIPNSTITGWQWNFGDGVTASGQNPSHTYALPGGYNVTLTVTSASGCQATLTKFNFVQVVVRPAPAFSNSPPSTCSAPFVVSFNNTSTGAGTLTYNWTFDDGTTSTATSPPKSYSAAGSYPVKLVVNSSFGCSDSITQTVTIAAGVTTDFTTAGICINKTTTFTNSGSTPVSSTWRFGDGGQSTARNPIHTYTAAGNYQVTLVNVYSGCTDSVTKTVTIAANPVVDFTADNTTACAAPFNVNFQNTTPAAVSYNWNFGDGTATSAAAAPLHTYNTLGNYNVSLTVTDNNGCIDSTTKAAFINITDPQLSVGTGGTGACAPHRYSPVAIINSSDPVTSYSWDFGEGDPPDTSPTPTHMYNMPGTYDMTVTITTAGGCQRSFTRQIRVGVPAANVDFTADATSICPFTPAFFHGTSTTPGLTWQWGFGDGGSARVQEPSHIYTDTGSYTVTMLAINNGCISRVIKTRYITVVPPIARFSAQVDCASGRTVQFINETITGPGAGTLTYSWNFGDPSIPVSTDPSPTVVYNNVGIYKAVMTVFSSNGCSNSDTLDVTILNEPADFTIARNQVCRDISFEMTATPLNPAYITNYTWAIGANPPVTGGPVQSFTVNTNGSYDVTLQVTDINGCLHTQTKTDFITVDAPVANFSVPQAVCGPDAATFTDLSVSTSTITSWLWDFGDGQTQSYTAPPFIHNYADTGNYDVTLTVTDVNGCIGTQLRPAIVSVRRPVAFFRKDTTMWCPSVPVSFADSSSGTNLTYLWSFGDGNTSTQEDPVNIFNGSETDYTISLRVTDDLGCSDSLSRQDYIRIRLPKVDFSIDDSATICVPFIVNFTLNGSDYQSAMWDFGDGSPTSTEINPQHAYQSYGTFAPTVQLMGNGGCTADTSNNVVVTDPSTLPFNYTAPETCNSLTVDFSVAPFPDTQFTLWFGDGQADSSQTTQVTHTYGPAFYRPYVVLKQPSGCEVIVDGQTEIRVLGAEPIFGIDNKQLCDSGTVNFTSLTLGNDPITSYNWDFGDNNTASDINPSHNYTSPGVYRTTLSVTTQGNCSSSFSDTVKVFTTPVATITSKDTVCINEVVDFTSFVQPDTATISYNWVFSDGTNASVRNPVKIFRAPGSFSAELTTSIIYGCSSVVSRPINVVPLPVVDPIADQNILVGQGVTIPATYSPGLLQYNWLPALGLDCTDCPNPFASPKKDTRYTVTVTDQYGCSGAGSVTVIVTCNNNNFFIPNTFSPNNDGVNDRFYPRGTGLVRVQSFMIFNRWGEVVFEKKNFVVNTASEGWDGMHKGKPAIADVYIYQMEIICENSQIIPVKGNIMLLR